MTKEDIKLVKSHDSNGQLTWQFTADGRHLARGQNSPAEEVTMTKMWTWTLRDNTLSKEDGWLFWQPK